MKTSVQFLTTWFVFSHLNWVFRMTSQWPGSESIASANYEVSRAWRVKENFRDRSGCESLDGASSLVIQWIGNAIQTKIKEIANVVGTFKNHLRGIINAVLNTFTNAMAERLNGKIQEVKACGRGYRKFENFRNAILFFHGGLYLHPLN
ncbi:MAG TPA: hypothetical protein DCQ26_07865 [Marinilabiliales bacterium]|nr:MAG: hypothetical protein A2W84_17195 [Bacteroidetes bacterium GWC2_40_13]OFX73394.1 MAG: hypothetical protein A2W96_03770 [Bacteroidetes bacterium GWD2_40_43]OFX94744.1 MAG: hypothetical protein A2W97_18675 [Bacteroidetes bacterium GWE2_40_63]OFY24726.1 MAG: hypothetical protein A2W88_16635 [Bacteroidetes bacterium GWF2_40_13]OFZ27605.1 MAG: hypothetical protein A2437_05730 [Bacteroidetes bacterium RIFOXYC2_FULL_40_12]HAM98515.1 hypothetical protein [Marinilabiliales bacterium]